MQRRTSGALLVFLLLLQAIVLLTLGMFGDKVGELIDVPKNWLLPITAFLLICSVMLTILIQRYEKVQGAITFPALRLKPILSVMSNGLAAIGVIVYLYALYVGSIGSGNLLIGILGNIGALLVYLRFSGFMFTFAREEWNTDRRVLPFMTAIAMSFSCIALAGIHLYALVGMLTA